MVRFENSRERKGKRDSRGGRRSFGDRPRGRRAPSRESGRYSRNRREVEMTKVTCSSCGAECEVPFKPTSSKPVYCNDCFAKNKPNSDKSSKQDFDTINEKLDKIMKALEIE